jgi:hypothetical protein
MTDLERVPPAAPVTVDIDTLRYLGYDPDNVATRALVLLAHRYQLDPLLGEIQLIADSKGRRLYVTRDGMLAVAHASGHLDGIVVEEQRRNTEGNGWTAYVSVWRNDMAHPFRYGAQCKDTEAQARAGNGPEMALARAERRALKRAFRIRSDFYPERPDVDDLDTDIEVPERTPDMGGGAREASMRPPAPRTDDDASEWVEPTREQHIQMRDLRAQLGLADRESRDHWHTLLGRALGREVTDTRVLNRADIARCIAFLTNELVEHAQAMANARIEDAEIVEDEAEADDRDGI